MHALAKSDTWCISVVGRNIIPTHVTSLKQSPFFIQVSSWKDFLSLQKLTPQPFQGNFVNGAFIEVLVFSKLLPLLLYFISYLYSY